MRHSKDSLLWSPSEDFKANSNMQAYLNWLGETESLTFDTYHDLWNWTNVHTEEFWESLIQYFDISFSGSFEKVKSQKVMPGVKWFEGIYLNYAEHVFKQENDSNPALIFKSETHSIQFITWKELKQQVASLQHYLKSKGVGKGDRVIGYLPNTPQATIAFLATNSLGAIWSSASPDFGLDALIDRFAQIEPKVLIATDGYRYGGKSFDKTEIVSQLQKQIPSLQHTVLVSYLTAHAEIGGAFSSWESIVNQNKGEELTFERVPFNDPIWVLYSSGTTGKPKAIMHSVGGILLEHFKYLSFHQDVKKGERCFWYTTTGWMMWNYIQSSLLLGATMVIYDGSLTYPTMESLWQYAEQVKVNHFGTSAGFLLVNAKAGLDIKEKFDLSGLRSIGSTGSTLTEEGFEYVYQNVKEDVWLTSISGGTDVCTAFVGGNPLTGVYSGEIQTRALGCHLLAFDEQGRSVEQEFGEMVIVNPMPSMPVGFWGDLAGERYKQSYFELYPGIWRQGDWVEITQHDGIKIFGRSDATLNRGGVRIGTSEVYNALADVTEIKDSLVVCLEKPNGEFVMPLFVVLSEGMNIEGSLTKKVVDMIRSKYTPRHVPDQLIKVKEIPYTISGKKLEMPIKKILMGMDANEVVNFGALKNPGSIQEFVELRNNFK